MRNRFIAVLLLASLPLSVAIAQSPQDQFKAAYEKAEAANKQAGAARNQWTTTAKALKGAKSAADAGDFEKATKLAQQAEALAHASFAQAQREDGRWTIRLEPRLILVEPRAKRAHQGWRYLEEKNAPRDLAAGEMQGDVLPGRLVKDLAKLGLV